MNGPNGVLLMNPFCRSLVRSIACSLLHIRYVHICVAVSIVCVVHHLNNVERFVRALTTHTHRPFAQIHRVHRIQICVDMMNRLKNGAKRYEYKTKRVCVCVNAADRMHAVNEKERKKKKRPYSYVTQSVVQAAAAAAASVTAATMITMNMQPGKSKQPTNQPSKQAAS